MGARAPKRKARKRLRDGLGYGLVRVAIVWFNLLPEALALHFGRMLGWLGWALSARYRKQILRHMDIAFRDEVPAAQKRAWMKANFLHVGQSVAEFARIGRLNPAMVSQRFELEDLERLRELLDQQPIRRGRRRGLLCVVAHHGNWELAGYAAALHGLPIHSVARPLDHPGLNALIKELRERSGNRIVEKYQVLWKLKKLLDQGAMVTLSVDQNGGVAGTFVPMFGTLASTVASPAELQMVARVPIAVCSCNRLSDGKRHKFHIWDVIEYRPGGDADRERVRILERINAAYERAVRAYPEQWLWVHKRWKTRPPDETPLPNGLPPRAVAPACTS